VSAAFGLYPTRDLVPAQRAAAGTVVALDTPVFDNGVGLFRKSWWLPVPAQLPSARALRLADSQLQARFVARRFNVNTSNTAWISATRELGESRTKLDLTWPARVVSIPRQSLHGGFTFDLLRADGNHVAAQPTQSGRTGSELAEPWVGTPLVVRIVAPLFDLDLRQDNVGIDTGIGAKLRLRAAPGGPGGGATGIVKEQAGVMMLLGQQLRQLTLQGAPTSPRLKLFAELADAAPAMLLWQALLPGEQASAELPAQPIADEWAPAFEQLRTLAGDAATRPALLRLDIESDAPCTVTLTQLQLALDADFELLAEAQRFDFDGQSRRSAALALDLPAGGSPEALRLGGRVNIEAGSDAGAAALPADGRRGALLGADQAVVQPVQLAAPASLAGLALAWSPLSDMVTGRLRLLADDGGRPGARVLVEQAFEIDTPQLDWLALRWSAIDLQSQTLWIEFSLLGGIGLWLFATTPVAPAGWIEQGAVLPPTRLLLNETMALHWLAPAADGANQRAVGVRIAGNVIASELPAQTLALQVPKPSLALLAAHALQFTGGARGSVTVESALLTMRL
jgi:hypothetical protein